jgi:N-methylhydantoinase A/oxoprolinase/acetone carboxylase beta subunit
LIGNTHVSTHCKQPANVNLQPPKTTCSNLLSHAFSCRYAGILSAVGIHLADIVQEAQEPAAVALGTEEVGLTCHPGAWPGWSGLVWSGLVTKRPEFRVAPRTRLAAAQFTTHYKSTLSANIKRQRASPVQQVERQLSGRLDALQAQAAGRLADQGFAPDQIKVERFLHLRWACSLIQLRRPYIINQ